MGPIAAVVGVAAAYRLWPDHRSAAWLAFVAVVLQLVGPPLVAMVARAFVVKRHRAESVGGPGDPTPRVARLMRTTNVAAWSVELALLIYSFSGAGGANGA
jgi:hypothetical protein